jgi:hypothetical protein
VAPNLAILLPHESDREIPIAAQVVDQPRLVLAPERVGDDAADGVMMLGLLLNDVYATLAPMVKGQPQAELHTIGGTFPRDVPVNQGQHLARDDR